CDGLDRYLICLDCPSMAPAIAIAPKRNPISGEFRSQHRDRRFDLFPGQRGGCDVHRPILWSRSSWSVFTSGGVAHASDGSISQSDWGGVFARSLSRANPTGTVPSHLSSRL